jgi:hypothetical protein
VGLCLADEGWIVRFDGVGPVKVGMTLSQVNSVLHESYKVPADKDEQGCFMVDSTKHPDTGFMIEDGRVTRVDVDGRSTPTEEGIRVGDLESKVKLMYGPKVEVEPNNYDPQERYLTVRSIDGRYGIRFETDKGRISHFYAGRIASISYVEGCE